MLNLSAHRVPLELVPDRQKVVTAVFQNAARLRVAAHDQPGALAAITAKVYEAGVNVIDIRHSRIFTRLPAKDTMIEVECEARDAASIDDVETRLEAAGYMATDCKPYLADIQKRLKDAGLENEFQYRGVLDRAQKIAFLQSLDVMSAPATYDEPKGVSLLEAMACGVPMVQPRRGAFTEIVENTGGGLLGQPDDPQSLAEWILKVAKNKTLAEDLSANGFRGVREHYTAAHMADRVLEAYESVTCPTPSIQAMI